MRAAAIAAVLASHCGGMFGLWLSVAMPVWMLKGGFLGVELFFVLSGFLVGRQVIEVAYRPTPAAWARFMMRRWLRTLPLYWLWLALLLAVWPPQFWVPDHKALLPGAALLYGAFLQNLDWPTPWGNWFGVAWSLSVEEWFYLVVPAATMMLAHRLGWRRAVACVLVPVLVGPALRRLADTPDGRLPYSVTTALDQIGWGMAAAALSLHAPAAFARARAVALPGAALALSFFMLPPAVFNGRPHLVHTLGPDMVGVGLALCLPALAAWRGGQGAAERAVRWLATRSFGFYLTHLSVLELVSFWRYRQGGPAAAQIAVAAVAIVVIPVLSWRFVEAPLMRLRPALGRDGNLVRVQK